MVREAVASKPFKLQFGSYVVSGDAGRRRGRRGEPLGRARACCSLAVVLVMARDPRARLPRAPPPAAAGAGARRGGAHVRRDVGRRRVAHDRLDRRCCRCWSGSRSTTRSSSRRVSTRAERVPRARGRARVGGPVIATAWCGHGGGFLVLLLSPVPMVRVVRALLAGRRHRAGVRGSTLTAGFAVLAGERPLSRGARADHAAPVPVATAASPALRLLARSLPALVTRAGRGAFRRCSCGGPGGCCGSPSRWR